MVKYRSILNAISFGFTHFCHQANRRLLYHRNKPANFLFFCIWGTLNLLTCADSNTDTKTDRNGQKGEKEEKNMCHVSHITCHMSCVMCWVSRVTCHQKSPVHWEAGFPNVDRMSKHWKKSMTTQINLFSIKKALKYIYLKTLHLVLGIFCFWNR